MDRNRKWVARIWMKRAAGLREYIHDLQTGSLVAAFRPTSNFAGGWDWHG